MMHRDILQFFVLALLPVAAYISHFILSTVKRIKASTIATIHKLQIQYAVDRHEWLVGMPNNQIVILLYEVEHLYCS